MAEKTASELPIDKSHIIRIEQPSTSKRLAQFPWWLIGIAAVILWVAITIVVNENYNDVFNFIKAGLGLTAFTSIVSFFIAALLGLITGIGRVSRNVVVSNIATFYVEFIRGIPMLVLIFFLALVGVPAAVDGFNLIFSGLGNLLGSIGLDSIGQFIASIQIENKNVPLIARAIAALSITYGAFLAEVFRAGIQSVGRGQMEAARSLGMSYGQAMWHIILPQAIRNILPALGNDFVAMVKDSSLVSLLAVRDITHLARLHAGSSFRFREAFITLAIMYLTITVLLSLVLGQLESRLRSDE